MIVMGNLLGRVLAGASGNTKAKVFCMSFKGELISVSSVCSPSSLRHLLASHRVTFVNPPPVVVVLCCLGFPQVYKSGDDVSLPTDKPAVIWLQNGQLQFCTFSSK